MGLMKWLPLRKVTPSQYSFVEAGFKSFVLPDIRSEIWLKLWGNLSFNPISALTHSTLVDICQFPQTRPLAPDLTDSVGFDRPLWFAAAIWAICIVPSR